MSILRTKSDSLWEASYHKLYEDHNKLHAELFRVRSERDALQALLDGKIPSAAAWLMNKVARQREALDRLHNRVVAQRFILRVTNELGRLPTRDEAKLDAMGTLDEQEEKRLDAYLKTLQ